MAAIYTLKVLTEFASAHTLREYPGACSRLHGHNWKVETEVRASALNTVGMAVDFKTIRRAAHEIGERLDHYYLNEIEPFTEINPTAENIAAYFYCELASQLNDDAVKVYAVTLWETDRACVRYSEEEA
ncbi:MAG: 6-carboxytetrahydropterin synthase QueD [Gammaproteobacteria bacterium]|nr:6-carboxytetrahydropterin synthase QueD [Gammaproteobacteria bacterium]